MRTIFSPTVEPRLMATSVIRSPRYCGHFSWPPGKTTIHFPWKKKKPLVNTVTSLIRPNVFGPLVTVLTGFRTNIFAIASCYQTSKVPSRNFGGRQFFVRQENPLFIDSCPSSGHPPKKLPSIDLSGHTKNFASHMPTRLQKRKIGDYFLS